MWRQISGSTLLQVMACCLTVPSHYLNQCWLIISELQWHSYTGNVTRDASTINHWNAFQNYISKISLKFPRGQWVKLLIYAIMQESCLHLLGWGGKRCSHRDSFCEVLTDFVYCFNGIYSKWLHKITAREILKEIYLNFALSTVSAVGPGTVCYVIRRHINGPFQFPYIKRTKRLSASADKSIISLDQFMMIPRIWERASYSGVIFLNHSLNCFNEIHHCHSI